MSLGILQGGRITKGEGATSTGNGGRGPEGGKGSKELAFLGLSCVCLFPLVVCCFSAHDFLCLFCLPTPANPPFHPTDEMCGLRDIGEAWGFLRGGRERENKHSCRSQMYY